MTRERRKPEFFRFSEASRRTLNRDFQVHTNWTDGEGTIAQVIERARAVKLGEIAFTEHARATSDYYPAFFAEIDDLAAEVEEMKIYRGFEVKVCDPGGRLDMTSEMKQAADIVLGSVHSFPLASGGVAPARDFEQDEATEIEFSLAQAIIVAGEADVLSHPGGMCLRTFGTFPAERFEELIVLARQNDVAFEINDSYHQPVLANLLPILERHDPLISIGSDVHRVAQLGSCRDRLLQVLDL